MLHIIKNELVQGWFIFASVERTQSFCDILSSNGSSRLTPVPKNLLLLFLKTTILWIYLPEALAKPLFSTLSWLPYSVGPSPWLKKYSGT